MFVEARGLEIPRKGGQFPEDLFPADQDVALLGLQVRVLLDGPHDAVLESEGPGQDQILLFPAEGRQGEEDNQGKRQSFPHETPSG